jgi:hypothetical protein
MLTILVVVLLLLALGSFPAWPYSREWGYYPSSGLGLVVVIPGDIAAARKNLEQT